MRTLRSAGLALDSLTIFRRLLKDPVLSRFSALLHSSPEDPRSFIRDYSEFVAALYAVTDNFGDYLQKVVLEDENTYVLRAAAGRPIPEAIQNSLDRELSILRDLSRLTSSEVKAVCPEASGLSDWTNTVSDLPAVYAERMAALPTKGYGVFSRYHVFSLNDRGDLEPVLYPDPQRLSELTGYETERAKILANTEALLSGLPASNTLLYGDAGTGKSSTVKAIVNEYRERGLRLIEVKKNQLYRIPGLMNALSSNPLKFILFIDDLSFSANDDDFSALKAILEGNVNSRGQNLVIYATSNRRHLVKETLQDREGDDIHFFDTIQELMSLSARFGLTVTFSRPEKELYLKIVEALASQYDIRTDKEQLGIRAEAHALRNGGRSPRTARQFIELLKAGV
ncbi:MAG: ATP-binding protein [Lachnospiraceae bacterium]|nr:ATP-binding protein [Lachnospiraceae bacterium]